MKKLTNLLSLLVMLTMSVSVWAQTSVYCSPVTNNTFTSENGDGSAIAFKWQTTVNGDVVIDIISADASTTNVKYRGGNGFQQAIGGFKVNGAAADAYFTFKKVNDTTCRLTKIAEVPAGAVISYEGTLEWNSYVNDVEKTNGYRIGTTKMNEYVYGTHCYDLTAPTGVAVSATGYVSFNDVAGATDYFANIYDGAELVSTQAITNGGLLQFITTKTSYTIKVIAAVGEFGSAESEAAAWAPEAGRVYGIVSEYQNYHTSGMRFNSDENQVALTWVTDANGDVVIKILPYGETTADITFRGNGLGANLNNFTVLSGANFATSAPASTYFDRVGGKDGNKEFRLVKKDGVDLPYPCKIHTAGMNIEWNYGGGWGGIPEMTYTYGTTCQVNPGVPGHVSVSGTGRVQHDNVAGAVAYAARFKKDGAIVMQFDITSGEPINWVSTEDATYQVTVLAFDAEGNMFDESETYNWTVEAGKVFGKSKYCDWLWNTTANDGWPVIMTWVTEPNGNVTITLAPNGDQGDGATKFRGGGMPIDRFKVNGADASTFFSAAWSDNVVTLTKSATPLNNGAVISYEGTVEYTTGTHTNAWPTLKITDYIYGTKCTSADAVAPVITTFEKVSAGVDAITFHVVASDVDDEGTPQTITYSLAGTNGFVTTAVTPDGDGNFVVEGLKKNRDYTFTLTVTDPASNTAVSDPVVVRMQFDAEDNLALNKPAEAGCWENSGRVASKANDGDATTSWGTYDCQLKTDWATANVWTVDLGTIFDVDHIHIASKAASGNSHDSKIYASWDNEHFVEIASVRIGEDGSYDLTSLNTPARYLKLEAAGTGMIAIAEFEVYGLGYATTDAVAPLVTVSEVSKTENTATLKIVATDVDDAGVAHPVKSIAISGDNDFTTIENAVLDGEGNITLNGLKDNATYNFHVTVTDRVGLTAEQDIEVRVTFNTTTNLALASNGATAEAGANEAGHEPEDAIDGSATSYWGTYKNGGRDNWEEANTMTITLAASYNINKIVINVGGTQGAGQILRLEYLDKDENWVVFENNLDAADGSTIELPVVVSAQKLRLIGTKNNMIAIKEFEIYGSSYDDGDTEAPEITSATLVSAGEESAVVRVVATDNVGVYGLQVVDEAKGFDVTYDYVQGQNVTLEGLAPGTTYNFNVYALDRAGNVSEPAALNITTQENVNLPKTVAPVPTIPADRVISIYSDAYASAVKDGFDWLAYNSTATTEAKVIAGDNYRHYACGAGGEFAIGANFHDAETNAVGINISTRAALHVDVWSKEAYGQGIGITLNDNRLLLGYQLEAGWNSINVSLAELKGDNAADVLASLKWMKFTEITNKVIAIDNIYFYGIGITDAASNAENMSTYAGQTEDVILNRAFTADGLYTLCLPFDMSAQQIADAFGPCQIAYMNDNCELRGTLLHLDFTYTNSIQAGVPYLFVPENTMNYAVIEGVTIQNGYPSSTGNAWAKMYGTYNPTPVSTNYYILYSDKYLYQSSGEGNLKGLRAYFELSDDLPAGVRAKVVMGGQVVTDLQLLNNEITTNGKFIQDGQLFIVREGRIYNVQGQPVK